MGAGQALFEMKCTDPPEANLDHAVDNPASLTHGGGRRYRPRCADGGNIAAEGGRVALAERRQGGPGWRVLVPLSVLFLASLWFLSQVAHATADSASPFAKLPDRYWATLGIACVSLAIGIGLVRALSAWVTAVTATYIGVARAQGLGVLASILLYIALAIAVLSQTKLDLSGIAVSGAVTGVIVGIAAQASFSNVIAGIVILFARPYQPGQFITARASAFAGIDYSGEVVDITLFYTTLISGQQEIRVPNSSMVASVVTLRPQPIDVYLPLVLTLARWEVISTAGLVHQLRDALPPGRHVAATVEQLNESTVQIGIRASIASDAERSTLERALAQILRAAPADGHTAPDPAGELHNV